MSTMHPRPIRSTSMPNLQSTILLRDETAHARIISKLPLPVELLERIVSEAWNSPLNRDERVLLATSLSLSGQTLLSIFIRTALRDVHITTPQYAQHYLQLVRPRGSFDPDSSYYLHPNACPIAHRLCRSLTFHVTSTRHPDATEPAVRLYADGDRSAEAVSATLYLLSLVPAFVPHLRRVTLQYTDWGFDDLFDQCRLLPLPAQVTHLELRYAFAPALERLADQARVFYDAAPSWTGMRWRMGEVVRLTVSGAPSRFVSAVAEMCPLLQTLEVDKHVEMDRKWLVPEGLKTLVLTDDPPVLDCSIDWWDLAKAVGGDALATFSSFEGMLSAPWEQLIGRQRLERICLRDGVNIEPT